jgi:NAD(P)-dependent dehydrogenase (short-subunit alcohol dehydrogenase family)
LSAQGWRVLIDARNTNRLNQTARELGQLVRGIPGDVTDPRHREELVRAVADEGAGLDLLVHNASGLGPSPMPTVAALRMEDFDDIWLTNVAAPLALTQALLPALRAADGVLISISSDAAVEHYEGWGGYAASKAALDHLTLTLAAENPGMAVYAVDPGDMRTAMHQAAFPGEDISDRPLPETVAPAFLELLRRRPASGRYRAAEFAPSTTAAAG